MIKNFVLGFSLIVYIKINQQEILAEYPNIDCSIYPDVTKTEVQIDYVSNTKVGLLECYCKADLPNRLNEYFTITRGTNVEDLQLCQSWFQKDLFMNLLPVLNVMAIVFLNMVMQTLFKGFIFFNFSYFLT